MTYIMHLVIQYGYEHAHRREESVRYSLVLPVPTNSTSAAPFLIAYVLLIYQRKLCCLDYVHNMSVNTCRLYTNFRINCNP